MCRGVTPRRGLDTFLGYDAQRAAQQQKAAVWAVAGQGRDHSGLQQGPDISFGGLPVVSRAPQTAATAPFSVYTLTLPTSKLQASPFADQQPGLPWTAAASPPSAPTQQTLEQPRADSDAVTSWLAGWAALAAEQRCSNSDDDDFDSVAAAAAATTAHYSHHSTCGGSGCSNVRAAACSSPSPHPLLAKLRSLDSQGSRCHHSAALPPLHPSPWRDTAALAATLAAVPTFPAAAAVRLKRRRQEPAAPRAKPAKKQQQSRSRLTPRQAAPAPPRLMPQQPTSQPAYKPPLGMAAAPALSPFLQAPLAASCLLNFPDSPSGSAASGSAATTPFELLDFCNLDAVFGSEECSWDEEEALMSELLADDDGSMLTGCAGAGLAGSLPAADLLARSLDLSDLFGL